MGGIHGANQEIFEPLKLPFEVLFSGNPEEDLKEWATQYEERIAKMNKLELLLYVLKVDNRRAYYKEPEIYLCEKLRKKIPSVEKIEAEMYSKFMDLKQRNKLHQPNIRVNPQIGPNDLCPCGSGKKFKKCCAGKGIFE